MQTPLRSTLVVFAAVLCLAGPRAYAQPAAANDPVFEVKDKKSDLRIVEKFAKILKFEKRITTVFGFDQEIINITKVERRPNMIRVHAEKPGVTSLVVVDEDNRMFTIEAFVIGDVRHLQAYLTRLFPHSAVSAVAIGDTVVLRGWVTQPEHITEMREIAEQFYGKVVDQMKVGGVQQVQLKVRVMEVQRAKIRRFGFNFFHADSGGAVVSTPGSLTPLTQLTDSAIRVAGLADPTIAFQILGGNSVFQGFLEALKSESLLKILAEPELVTTNGRPAQMLSGGEFPVLVPQSLGTTTIQWKQFGVRLQAVPIILGRGRVRLELQPEVSERDFVNAVQVGGLVVPGITTRRVNTQVEMRFGETFMIAGLLSMRTTATTDKVALLGELPWIGAAFRRIRYDETETELVIMVTPELVAPMKSGQAPPGGPGYFTESPVDRELYIDGRLEVPRYSDRCQGCNVDSVFNGPYGSSQLQGVQPMYAPQSSDGPSRVLKFNSSTSSSPVYDLPVPPSPKSGQSVAPQAGPAAGADGRTSMRNRYDRSKRAGASGGLLSRFRGPRTNSASRTNSSAFSNLFRGRTANGATPAARSFPQSQYRQSAGASTQDGLIRPASGYGAGYSSGGPSY